MLVSVIIPAYNEEKHIQDCIDSVRKQTYKDIEIIVICNKCRDKTFEIASKQSKAFELHHGGVSTARNKGAEKAKGDVLCFIDADSIMNPDLVEKVVYWAKKGFIGGTTQTKPVENKWFPRLFWGLGNWINYIYLTPSGFMFAKKDMFVPYNEALNLGEDTYALLALKKKGKVKYISNSTIYTSMRRLEKDGYFKTLFTQITGFLLKKKFKYRHIR